MLIALSVSIVPNEFILCLPPSPKALRGNLALYPAQPTHAAVATPLAAPAAGYDQKLIK